MGAKTWVVAHCDGDLKAALAALPPLDEAATQALVQGLWPGLAMQPPQTTDLSDLSPPEGQVVAGRLGAATLLASTDVALDNPSQLDPRFMAPTGWTIVHAMHSAVDWFGMAIWHDGQLQRSLSLSPDSGVIEDIGPRLPLEEAYWRGEHPADDPDDDEADRYPLPFHPLELAEAVLRQYFGFTMEGLIEPGDFQPEQVRLLRFGSPVRTTVPATAAPVAAKPWWKFW